MTAMPIRKGVTQVEVIKFIKHYIVVRFGIPKPIIVDNVMVFTGVKMGRFT
jgi:hypothetical protein